MRLTDTVTHRGKTNGANAIGRCVNGTAAMAAASALAMSLAVPVSAGTVMELEIETPSRQQTMKQVLYVQDGRARFATAGQVMLLRDRAIYVLNTRAHVYRVIYERDLAEMRQAMVKARGKIIESVQDLPADVRRDMAIEAMTKDANALLARMQVTARNEQDSVDERPCALWDVHYDDIRAMELCVAKPADLGLTASVFQDLHVFVEAMEPLLSSMGAVTVGLSADWLMLQEQKLDGIALRVRQYSNKELTQETRIKSVRAEQIPADRFDVPSDYYKR